MKHNTEIDFVNEKHLFSPLLIMLCFLLAMLLSIVLVIHYLSLKHEHLQLTRMIQENRKNNLPVKLSDQQKNELNLAQEIQASLNMPWLKMLSNLEKVKLNNPQIRLLHLAPNSHESAIKIIGEADDFEDILNFVNALNSQGYFLNAQIVSHKQLEDANELEIGNVTRRYQFVIQMVWEVKRNAS